MQVSDMRALRAIYTQQRLLKPTTHKSLPNPSLISFQSLQNPTFSRHFHPTGHLRRPGEPNSTTGDEEPRPVWSVFARSPATPKASITSDGGESGSENEMGPSSLVNGVSEIEKGKADRSVGKVKSGTGSVSGTSKSGKGKVKTSWVCSDCGEAHGQWMGRCRSCGQYNTLKQFSERNDDGKASGIGVSEKVRSWLPRGEDQPVRLSDVNRGISWKDRRIPLHGTFGNEVATVLGGGIVPGSLVLIGGDPGVGKSTLVLQIAALIAEGHELGKASRVLYVSGEESIEQIGSRADRMGIETEDLFLYSSTDIEDIIEKSQSIAPQALIVDSIQTVYLKGVAGSPGGIVQVKECTSAFLYFAKRTNIPVFLIGHVNKSGEIAGPRVLEHIVDSVLYMEGEKHSSYRLLRSVKNRFGSTDELGVFEMSQSGLQAVSNPGGMFLGEQFSDSEYLAGVAVAVTMDGSRSFLIEIQALCVSGQAVLQQVNGIQASRASMIISVLAKQAGLKLQENAIYLNVVSGVMLKETAGDLAIAAAICSSFLEYPIPNSTAFIGEIGLCGELRPVSAMDKRINTVAKLGYKTCIVPKSAEKSLRGTPGFKDMKIIGCKNLKEVINNVFRSN
ncbi:DNA repair protein RadA [Rosa sericea]